MNSPGSTDCSVSGSSVGGNVSAIWFSSLTNGDVAVRGCNGNVGLIDHLDGPTSVDAVALDGSGALPGPNDDQYFGLWPTSLGLIASGGGCGNCFGGDTTLILSKDQGKTFTYSKFAGTLTPPGSNDSLGAAALWISIDTSGGTHVFDDTLFNGDWWSSPTTPGPNATFTLTYEPMANSQGLCDEGPGAYFSASFPETRGAWVSPDGKTAMYGAGLDVPIGVCRSTDGGKTFKPIAFPGTAAVYDTCAPPTFVILGIDATHVVAATAGDGNLPMIVYRSADAGATWTAASSLPSSALNNVTIINGFVSADASTVWLVGNSPGTGANKWLGNLGALLYKSSDGGDTWTDVSTKLQTAQATLNGATSGIQAGFTNIYTGFALDANHVWVGTDFDGMFYSSTGGQ